VTLTESEPSIALKFDTPSLPLGFVKCAHFAVNIKAALAIFFHCWHGLSDAESNYWRVFPLI